MANLSVGGPLRELNFADHFRFHPVRIASQASRQRRRKRARFLLDALEPGTQLERELVCESCSHLAAEHQAIAFVIPDQQCSNPRTHPLGIRETADHEFLALDAFRFHPSAMPSRAVWLVARLRDNSSQSRAARL